MTIKLTSYLLERENITTIFKLVEEFTKKDKGKYQFKDPYISKRFWINYMNITDSKYVDDDFLAEASNKPIIELYSVEELTTLGFIYMGAVVYEFRKMLGLQNDHTIKVSLNDIYTKMSETSDLISRYKTFLSNPVGNFKLVDTKKYLDEFNEAERLFNSVCVMPMYSEDLTYEDMVTSAKIILTVEDYVSEWIDSIAGDVIVAKGCKENVALNKVDKKRLVNLAELLTAKNVKTLYANLITPDMVKFTGSSDEYYDSDQYVQTALYVFNLIDLPDKEFILGDHYSVYEEEIMVELSNLLDTM